MAISLYDVVKTTGEVKDIFKFTYNGRQYDRLSLSEKVRAGMEVSELMKRLTGRNYPVFVDNMESVDKSHMLGKFLYFSLANLLVEKEVLSKLCEDMGIPCAGGTRLSVGDAFRLRKK